MMEFWDYFMRRKPLLAVILGLFVASGFFMSALLHHNASSNSVSEPSASLVSDDQAASKPDPLPRVHVKIADPSEVAAIEYPIASTTAPATNPATPETEDVIDVPRTGSEGSVVSNWYFIVVSTSLALVLALITIAAARLILAYYRAQ